MPDVPQLRVVPSVQNGNHDGLGDTSSSNGDVLSPSAIRRRGYTGSATPPSSSLKLRALPTFSISSPVCKEAPVETRQRATHTTSNSQDGLLPLPVVTPGSRPGTPESQVPSTPSKEKYPAALTASERLLERIDGYFTTSVHSTASSKHKHPAQDHPDTKSRSSINGHSDLPNGSDKRLLTSHRSNSPIRPRDHILLPNARAYFSSRLTPRRMIQLLRLAILVFAVIGMFLSGTTRSKHLMRPPIYKLYNIPSSIGYEPTVHTPSQYGAPLRIYDFEAAMEHPRGINQQHVLVLLPLLVHERNDHNLAERASSILELVYNLDHPKHSISIGLLLVGNPASEARRETEDVIKAFILEHVKDDGYKRISLLTSSSLALHADVHGDDRHNTLLARARTFLVLSLLEADVDWVFWLDSSMHNLPSSILRDLLKYQNGEGVSSKASAAFAGYITPRDSLRPGVLHNTTQVDIILPNTRILGQTASDQHDLPEDWVPTRSNAKSERASFVVPLSSASGSVALVRAQAHFFGATFPSWNTGGANTERGQSAGRLSFGQFSSEKVGARVVGISNYYIEMRKEDE